MRRPDRTDEALSEASEVMFEAIPRTGSETIADKPAPDEPTSPANLHTAMSMIANAFVSINQTQSVEERGSLIELVRNMGGKNFSGSTNPADAEEWMRRIEKVFIALRLNNEQKILVARFLQEGSAYDWWTRMEQHYLDPSTINWEDFRLEFYDKYIPRTYLDAKLKEFLLLEQGSMSVVEYENKFYALSRYGPSFVADEIMMCGRFEDGLRRDIRMIVTAVGWKEFRGLVEAAKRVERCISDPQPDEEQHQQQQQHSHRTNGHGGQQN